MFEIAIHSPIRHQQLSVPEFDILIDGSTNSAIPPEDDLCGFSLQVILLPDSEHVKINNHSASVRLPRLVRELDGGASDVFQLPLLLQSGSTRIEIRRATEIRSSSERLRIIPRSRGADNAPIVPFDILGASPGAETLALWFETLGRLQRAVSGSLQMTNSAVEAIIHPGGLDYAMLVMKDGSDWRIEASHIAKPTLGISYSRHLVDQVASHRQTVFHETPLETNSASTQYAESVVASPVLGSNGSVEGVLYGVRSFTGSNLRRCIRPLEALWVQLVAESVTGALIRKENELAAARTRVLFEQAFSSKVVKKLIDDPMILQGREAEVTVLFADVRDFTKISERLGARDTCSFLSELLEQLTDCVMNQGGVVIDYYGDGLEAMWNAPTPQPDHALRACSAAIEMMESLKHVSNRWRKRVGHDVEIGVGIHSGTAQVGNSGTLRRVKYGPRGTTVNIASRVESATKTFGASILITSDTKHRLAVDALAPRIGQVRLRGVAEPVELYQLLGLGNRQAEKFALERLSIYEESLRLFEAGQPQKAVELLESNRRSHADSQNGKGCLEFFYDYLQKSDKRHVDSETGEPIFDLTAT